MPKPRPVHDFARYLRTETTGGLILLAATALALLWANSPWGDAYRALRDFGIGPHWLHLDLSVGDWAKDGLLALFFFVAGLELKRELVVGELSRLKQAVLPAIAALGGMIVPALVALAAAWGTPGIDRAWAIPVATDIAFALGVLALTGSNLPSSARVFLLSLAVVDDLGAIVVIALLFTTGFNLVAAAVAVAACALYAFLQHRRVRSPWLYVPLVVITWVAVHTTGIHATIAGVVLGLLTRVRPDPGEEAAPAVRLEHRLQPWSAAVAVPVFALFAAGIEIDAKSLSEVFTTALPLGVLLGLVVGKPIGILGASALAVSTGLAERPGGTGWRDLAALSLLGGVGFTVSLLIADLALSGEAAERAKAAVLLASMVASLGAAVLLLRRNRVHGARED
ncbi:NhaA family Na+:H+ antiporter [Amycolatopsis bartoniae]|uniref:Na(+)/H(+) antiporter NhaA n=1 Tax=Amycolatopsis bartoniae TaxID=941986 RepID=A0A8H9IXS8_9PSEU|nr:Na+/H+ antiporter NhaA [Amycolatopsis bartoniae]MBB2935190.1 NhaA family Na+:H+ antiporter [Amycolatopsis bartoniae]TVS99380.1 Na+/H+ antiporter NhaA [Amycolatopsis bartoniae]GHF75000.1 Na(+)/H(+) antiporter NhaA [Amycolatopsis bartoniae]